MVGAGRLGIAARLVRAALSDMATASADDGSKLLCLIRHGQGMHNPRLDPRFLYHLTQGHDPELTPLGAQQAAALGSRLRAEGRSSAFEAIVVSPLSRAIQTCSLVFSGDCTTPRWLCALLTERCCARADVGTPKSALRALRPEASGWLGWDELEERWWPARTLSQDEYWPVVRVGRFKAWLLAREERCLALVGHKGFLQCFTAGSSSRIAGALHQTHGRTGNHRSGVQRRKTGFCNSGGPRA